MSGIPTEYMIMDLYLKDTGAKYEIKEEEWAFFLAFSAFKMTSIAQGVYKRSLMGSASSTRGSSFGAVAKASAQLALDLSK